MSPNCHSKETCGTPNSRFASENLTVIAFSINVVNLKSLCCSCGLPGSPTRLLFSFQVSWELENSKWVGEPDYVVGCCTVARRETCGTLKCQFYLRIIVFINVVNLKSLWCSSGLLHCGWERYSRKTS